MNKMVKLLIGAVVAVVLLVVIALGVVVWQMDSIAKRGLEAGGTYAMGVNTTVDSVSISLLGGTVGVNEMKVANPEGFKAANITDFKSFAIAVETGTLFEDVIVVPSIDLSDLTMNIEKSGGKTNVSVIADNLKRLGSGEADAPESEGGSSKKVKVGKVTLRNITANVQLAEIGGDLSTVKVNVPELVLEDVSSDKGVPMAEVIKRIWPAILAAIVEKGGGIIPTDLLNDLQGDVLGLAQNLGGDAAKLMSQVGGELGAKLGDVAGQLGKDVGKAVGDVTDKLGEDVGKQIEKGVGDLLPGQKKSEDGESTDGEKKSNAIEEGLKGLLGGDKKE